MTKVALLQIIGVLLAEWVLYYFIQHTVILYKGRLQCKISSVREYAAQVILFQEHLPVPSIDKADKKGMQVKALEYADEDRDFYLVQTPKNRGLKSRNVGEKVKVMVNPENHRDFCFKEVIEHRIINISLVQKYLLRTYLLISFLSFVGLAT